MSVQSVQWVDSPAVTPDAVSRGVPVNGGREVYFDSSIDRAQYANGGGGGADIADPGFQMTPAAAMTPNALAETLPRDVLEAMARGQALSPEQIVALKRNNPPPQQQPSIHVPQIAIPQMPVSGNELIIPVGGGLTARVTFSARPLAKNWRRLIRHLEIEADPTDEEDDERERANQVEQKRAAEEHLAGIRAELAREADEQARDLRAGDESSQPELPRPIKRRKRKNVGAPPGAEELAGDNGVG